MACCSIVIKVFIVLGGSGQQPSHCFDGLFWRSFFQLNIIHRQTSEQLLSWYLHPVLRQSMSSPVPGCLLLSPSQAHWILFLLPQRPMSLSAFYTHYKNYQNLWLEFVLVTNGYIPLLLFRECWEKVWDSRVTGRTLLLMAQEVWVWCVWSPYPVPQATWRAQVVARHTDGCFTGEDQWVWEGVVL